MATDEPRFSNKKINPEQKNPKPMSQNTPIKQNLNTSDLNQPIAKKSKFKKIAAWTTGILVVFLIAWYLSGAISSLLKVFTKNYSDGSPFLKNIISDVDITKLQGEGDGRINILLLGMPGSNYPGPELTDTIIILSINPHDNTAAMLSVPRDLYVKPPDFYSYTKINSVYTLAEQQKSAIDQGSQSGTLIQKYVEAQDGYSKIKETVGEIVDLPIHYFIKMDFIGFEKIVDELGGVDVMVEKDLYDPYYPDGKFGYETFKISTGQHHLNGNQALKYARSRETTSDFDRAARQQQILVSLKENAVNLSLFDIGKISVLVDLISDHFRTDLTLKEMERLIEILSQVDTSTMVNQVLDNSVDGGLISSSAGGMYILQPRAGLGEYSEIQAIAHNIFKDPYLLQEAAIIEVRNGTTTAGLASQAAEVLENYNYNIQSIINAKALTETTRIVDYTNGQKPFTIQFLQQRMGVKVITANPPEGSTIEIAIILGEDFQGL